MKLRNYLVVGMGILISTAILGSQTVEAAGVEKSTGTSTAKFELEAGDTETIPEIIDPEIKPPLPNKGPLTLNAVSSFKFPTKKIGTEATAPLEAQPLTLIDDGIDGGTKLGLQVTDTRGQDLGWNLKVSATAFETIDKTIELKGAVVTIPAGKLTTKAGVDPLLKPTAHKVALSTTAQSIMSATPTQGRSSWSNDFQGNGEKVTLDVPSGNKVASYVSTITWSLEDAP